jgi:hypothetical protein
MVSGGRSFAKPPTAQTWLQPISPSVRPRRPGKQHLSFIAKNLSFNAKVVNTEHTEHTEVRFRTELETTTPRSEEGHIAVGYLDFFPVCRGLINYSG